MTLHQLSFDFTFPVATDRQKRERPWRIRKLARRYRLPEWQARVYAAEMHLPSEEGLI